VSVIVVMAENYKPVNSVIHIGCFNVAELCVIQWLYWGSLGPLAKRYFNGHISDIKMLLRLQLPGYASHFVWKLQEENLCSFLVANICLYLSVFLQFMSWARHR